MLKLAEAVQRLSVENAFTVLGRAGELEAQGRSVVNLGLELAQIGATLHAHEQREGRRAQASGSQEPVGQTDPNHHGQQQARVVRTEAGGGAKLPRVLAV
jgi:hypothetical protein